jgi:hypothetical protein
MKGPLTAHQSSAIFFCDAHLQSRRMRSVSVVSPGRQVQESAAAVPLLKDTWGSAIDKAHWRRLEYAGGAVLLCAAAAAGAVRLTNIRAYVGSRHARLQRRDLYDSGERLRHGDVRLERRPPGRRTRLGRTTARVRSSTKRSIRYTRSWMRRGISSIRWCWESRCQRIAGRSEGKEPQGHSEGSVHWQILAFWGPAALNST